MRNFLLGIGVGVLAGVTGTCLYYYWGWRDMSDEEKAEIIATWQEQINENRMSQALLN